MPQPTISCFYTTVRNMAAERSYGFLGEHGKRLAAGEQYTVPGNLVDQLAARPGRRHFNGLQRAVDDGDLVIVNTPSIHLFDFQLDETKVLRINNGSLGAVDPCWGAYSSSSE